MDLNREALVPRMRRHSTSVFAEMSMRARAVGAINLGQGFPDGDGPDVLKEAAIRSRWCDDVDI